MPRKIILDVDTGSDDAVAIIAAVLAPEFDVIGICSVNGNREVKLTTENTLRVVEMLGVDIPVYKGCEFPMTATLFDGWNQIMTNFPMTSRKPGQPIREGTMSGLTSKIHGDYLPLPAATIKEEDIGAVEYYLKTLNASDGDIEIVAVGPLTNLGVALRADPRIAKKIKAIWIMGGGSEVNNYTPSAEYNFWVDPESAEIVMQSGVPLNIVPLDATHAAYLTKADSDEIRAIGKPYTTAIADFIDQRIEGYSGDSDMKAVGGAPIHDALAVIAMIDETVLKDFREVNCHVDIGGGYSDGMTVVDKRNKVIPIPTNCRFAFDADRDKFARMLIDVLKNAN